MHTLCTLFILVSIVNVIYSQRSGCSISFPKANDQDEPVLLTVGEDDKYELAIPENGKFTLEPSEDIILLCPNPRNSIVGVNQNLAPASCVKNEILKVDNEQYDFDEIRCQKASRGDVKPTNNRCGNNRGRVIDIGFQVTRSDWVTLIRVCYDSDNANTLYTEHIVYGQSINQASKQSKRPQFQANEVPKGLSINTLYTQASQTATFASILGSQKLANRYIRQNSYLARGHLSPDADFLFAPLQFATYFYINTCPQWSNINSGNWKSLESMVRRSAGKHGDPFKIITGTHEVLEYPDEDGNLKSMSLDESGLIPIPKFIWKVVYSETSGQGIAFVSINDPNIESVTDDLILCQDVCSRYNWIGSKWDIPDKGYIYCCDIRQLQKTVKTIPKLSVSGILRA